eukprot:284043_1
MVIPDHIEPFPCSHHASDHQMRILYEIMNSLYPHHAHHTVTHSNQELLPICIWRSSSTAIISLHLLRMESPTNTQHPWHDSVPSFGNAITQINAMCFEGRDRADTRISIKDSDDGSRKIYQELMMITINGDGHTTEIIDKILHMHEQEQKAKKKKAKRKGKNKNQKAQEDEDLAAFGIDIN